MNTFLLKTAFEAFNFLDDIKRYNQDEINKCYDLYDKSKNLPRKKKKRARKAIKKDFLFWKTMENFYETNYNF